MRSILLFGLIMILISVLIGCAEEETVYGDLPFIEMEQSTIVLSEQTELCEKVPESVFCTDTKDIGYEQPSYDYAIEVLKEMNANFTYVADDTWHYNQTVSEHLRGDCEDIASTMAMHMINDGIGKEYLYLVYRKTSETTAHIFLAVNTYDVGLIHLDYGNSGYPIEPQINFHLPLDDVSVWIKGNI
jgi:predicted transglutaminase-like cysteine proteinase